MRYAYRACLRACWKGDCRILLFVRPYFHSRKMFQGVYICISRILTGEDWGGTGTTHTIVVELTSERLSMIYVTETAGNLESTRENNSSLMGSGWTTVPPDLPTSQSAEVVCQLISLDCRVQTKIYASALRDIIGWWQTSRGRSCERLLTDQLVNISMSNF